MYPHEKVHREIFCFSVSGQAAAGKKIIMCGVVQAATVH